MAYKDWKDNIYVIAAIIYVGGMFPLYYLYEANRANGYDIIWTVSYISIAGAMLLFLQLLAAAWTTREPPKVSSGSSS
jgi:hypothetical protein